MIYGKLYDIISVPSYTAGIYHLYGYAFGVSIKDIISEIYHPFGKERITLKKLLEKSQGVFSGAVRQTRTADLILTKDVLYHLSHNSITDNVMYFTIISSRCQELFLKKSKFFQIATYLSCKSLLSSSIKVLKSLN